jgi:hypothetical protein
VARANERTVGVWSRVGHCEDSGTCEPQFWMDLVFAASGMNRWTDCGELLSVIRCSSRGQSGVCVTYNF